MNPTALTGVQIGVLTRFQVAFERGLLPRNRASGYVQAVMPNHVQIALARVCAAFARQYPEWTASLFDEHFLKSQEVVPLLAELLTRRGRPDPAHLARQEALQPLYDRRALERIAAHTEAFRRQLEEEWPKAQDAGAKVILRSIGSARPVEEIGRGESALLGLVMPTHGFTAPWAMLRFALRLPRRRSTRAGGKIGPLFTPGIEGTATCILYPLLHFLLGVGWINRFFTLITPTHYYRRYHEPEATLKELE